MERPLLEKGSNVFIRYSKAIPILHKVMSFKESSFSSLVSSRKPFGLATNFNDFKDSGSIRIYANKKIGYLDASYLIPRNEEWLNKWKLYIPKAIGSGNIREDWIKSIKGAPGTICTETYIVVGPFDNEEIADNVSSYIQTKFFHFLMGLKKITQDATSKVYDFVPMQDFSRSWSDKDLYAKYNLTDEEVQYIESMVRNEIGTEC